MSKKSSSVVLLAILGITAAVWLLTQKNVICLLIGLTALIVFVVADTLVSIWKEPPKRMRPVLQAVLTCVAGGGLVVYILSLLVRNPF